MAGKRYGELVVVAEAGWLVYRGGSRSRLVIVQCACGEVWTVRADHVRRGLIQRCAGCKAKRNATYQRDEVSVRLPNGKTIAQVAHDSCLELGTVYRRWLRGWPAEKLGLPLRMDRRRINLGGHVDLAERRRTVWPDHGAGASR